MFEAHPVPQNVTEFQFHLVGDMTIKQFVYLASGLGSAYLVFALLGTKLPLLAYPLIIILAGTGAALAFLPIQERPLDHWLGAYFRAIFQPTKRTYKSKILTKEDPLFKSRLQIFLNTRRRALLTPFPAAKTKSTPFSFSAQTMMQQNAPQQQLGGAPVSAAPAVQPASSPAAGPKKPFAWNSPTPVTPEPTKGVNLQSSTTAAVSPIAPPIQLHTPSITIIAPEQQSISPAQVGNTAVRQMPIQSTPDLVQQQTSQPTMLGTAGLSPVALPVTASNQTTSQPVNSTNTKSSTNTPPVIVKSDSLFTVNMPVTAGTKPVEVIPTPVNSRPAQPAVSQPSPSPTSSNFVVPNIPLGAMIGNATPKVNLPSKPVVSAQPKPAMIAKDQTTAVPTEADLEHTIELAKQVHQVQQKIIQTEEQIGAIKSQAAAQDANPKQYLNQFHQLLGELQNLNQQAANLSSQVAQLTNEPMKLPSLQADLIVKPKSIPTITLTSIANVINGIVTDSNGNYLEGAIILAHDKSGIPVRALKTNKLGQFVAATPLNNGIYTITIEKDDLVFDTIEIELKGTLLKPILITSKPVAGGVANG